MFGLPSNHPLSRAVEVLVCEHEHTTDHVTGVEDGLLVQLEQAVASSTAGAPGGGTGTGSPLNVAALTLLAEIADTINRQLPPGVLTVYRDVSVCHRLRWLTRSLAGYEDAQWLQELCESWAGRIRELLAPSRHVPLRGQSCPECKCRTYPHQDEDGGTILSPPLVAHLSEPRLRVECLACEYQWAGETTIELVFSSIMENTHLTT